MNTASGRGDSRMPWLSRLMVAVAAALLAVALVTPVWRIDLIAPQYPEGLGMLIRADTITGVKPADLDNINGLNHYIGMKAIVPGAIPVLDVMPIGIMVLVVLGLAASVIGRRWAVWTWLGLFAAGGAAAMYEFWAWSYDYGHHLASDAIIKIPGMTYQPPIIGTKQLLNFTAASWPTTGAIAAGIGFIIAGAALLLTRRKKSDGAPGSHSQVKVAASLLIFLAAAGAIVPRDMHAQADTVIVTPRGPTLEAALQSVRTGGVVLVMPGRYAVHELTLTRPVTIAGRNFPTLDGGNRGEIIRINADDVTITGLRVTRVGVSYTKDRAAIRATEVRNCRIVGNRIDEALFGIYLAKSTGCRIERNVLRASGRTEGTSGNGIHLWASTHATIADNSVAGFRDGIYFEFVHNTDVIRNVSENNLRYGLHFMYSDDCEYVSNIFRNNGSGVAVMYTKRIHMVANRFEHNWGSAAYGLLLKEIADSRIERNVFQENTTGLFADGADRIRATGNEFTRNGWAVKVGGSTQDGFFSGNNFTDNTFDVTTNSHEPTTKFVGNFWSAYKGYDLDRDGVGDVPYAPVRLFAVIVERNPQAIVLMRSALVSLLDATERAMPSLTPELFVDAKPAMRRIG